MTDDEEKIELSKPVNNNGMMGLNFPLGMIDRKCKGKKGETLYRRDKGSGADSRERPLERYLEDRLNEYKAAGEKVARNLNLFQMNRARKGVKAHRPKADLVKNEVLRLAELHKSRGCSLNSFIAKKVKRSAVRVRQIRAEEEKRKSSEKS